MPNLALAKQGESISPPPLIHVIGHNVCGIAGIFRYAGAITESDEKALRLMVACLEHRGPDAVGVWRDPRNEILLGHTRLSIRDLSEQGAQPMASRSGKSVITYNGEIYSEDDLIQLLGIESGGIKGTSDTSVLLESIDALGLHRVLPHLIGMFAFALFETEKRRLTLVRDRLGIKPLYWADEGGALIFASELRALSQHPSIGRNLDMNSVGTFLRLGYVPAPYSIFSRVHKLEPGTLISLQRGGRLVAEAYWDIHESAATGGLESRTGSYQDRLEALEQLLQDSVRRRLVSDVPIGSLLSGGIDSSLVTALMVAESSRPVRTYSVGFEETGFDESGFATKIAGHLGTEHTNLTVGSKEALAIVPHIRDYYTEPFADSSQIPTLLLSHFVSNDLKVVLTGDGGDETFAGYERYVVGLKFLQHGAIAGLPISLATSHARRMISDLLSGRAGILRTAKSVRRKLLRLQEVREASHAFHPALAYRDMMSHWSSLSTILTDPAEHTTLFDSITTTDDGTSILSMMRLLDLQTYLPDDILTKVDRATMSFGLEARVPLLDHRLVEFSWNFADSELIRGGKGKIPLREVLGKYVPPDLFERPKMGFGVPLGNWLRTDLRSWAEELIYSPSLAERANIDSSALVRAWKEHANGLDLGYRLWNVLMLLSWLESLEDWD